jgi:hypothetical protein
MKAGHNQRATVLFNFAHYPDRTDRRSDLCSYDGVLRELRNKLDFKVVG